MSPKPKSVASGPLFKSRLPYRFFITVVAIACLFLLFGVFYLIGRLNLGQAIFCFLLFSGYIYARFGRYAARIILMSNKIEVAYFFPWDRPLAFDFQYLASLDHLDIPGAYTFKEYRWYRNYRKLSLTNEKNEFCEIKYNINSSDDSLLVRQLEGLIRSAGPGRAARPR